MPAVHTHLRPHLAERPRPGSGRLTAADRRRQIMQVATVLFSRHGFQGTTTRQIAERAGVNEALIFRHFPSKEELYWGVLDSNCAGKPQRELRRRLAQAQDARSLFTAVAEDILSRDITLSRLLWFSALENHRLSGRFFQTYSAGYYEELAGHIAARISRGEFRRVDPMLAARGFIGMAAHYFLVQELFGAKRYQKFERRRVSQTLADIWLTGMLESRLFHNGSGHGRNGRAKPGAK